METGTTVARALARQDVPLMRKLLDLFGRAFQDDSTYQSRQPDDAYLASRRAKRATKPLTAEGAEDARRCAAPKSLSALQGGEGGARRGAMGG